MSTCADINVRMKDMDHIPYYRFYHFACPHCPFLLYPAEAFFENGTNNREEVSENGDES